MTIEIRGLTFRYRKLTALDTVTVTAAPGRITAVLGPNAAGKSTLLRCMTGALPPSDGVVLIGNRPAHRLAPRRLARDLAYVPQRTTVSASFTVRQVVELGRFALDPAPARVDAALERLELSAIADRPYPALSVGQQQRVGLARAIVQLEPHGHLVLDEPMSAMDLAHIGVSVELLGDVARAGATVIIAMHDIALAAAFADDAWLLRDGRLVEAGPTGAVLTPRRLREVLDVDFHRVEVGDGGTLMVPETWIDRQDGDGRDR